jgi:hypothetical protein
VLAVARFTYAAALLRVPNIFATHLFINAFAVAQFTRHRLHVYICVSVSGASFVFGVAHDPGRVAQRPAAEADVTQRSPRRSCRLRRAGAGAGRPSGGIGGRRAIL